MKRLGVILIVFLTLLPVFVFSGGQKEQPKAEREEPKLLRIKSVAWITKKAFIGEAAEEFMLKHPEIKIEFESMEEAEVAKLVIQWSGGKSDSDLVVVEDPSTTTAFVVKDLIYNFEELGLWDDFAKDKLISSFLDIGTVKGKTYYLPIMGEIYWYNVNKIILKNAGLLDNEGNVPEPKNWEDVLDMADKAKAITFEPSMSINFAPPGWIISSFYSQLKGLKGTMFEADGTTILTDTPESRMILKTWKKAIDRKLVTTATFTDCNAGRKLFKAGKLALLYESGSRWQEAAPLLGSANVGPMPFPGGLENGSYLFVAGFAIPRASSAPKTALKFLQEVYLKDRYQSKMLNVYGKMPTLESAYDLAVSPGWNQMKIAAAKSTPFPLYKEWPQFKDGASDYILQYLYGKIDLDASFNGMKEVLNSIDRTIY